MAEEVQKNDFDCSIYVSSFDGYSDLWRPFFDCFFKYWEDVPFPVYLGTNSKKFDDDRVISLPAAESNNWTDRAYEHIKQIPSKYVLMFLEFVHGWYPYHDIVN